MTLAPPASAVPMVSPIRPNPAITLAIPSILRYFIACSFPANRPGETRRRCSARDFCRGLLDVHHLFRVYSVDGRRGPELHVGHGPFGPAHHEARDLRAIALEQRDLGLRLVEPEARRVVSLRRGDLLPAKALEREEQISDLALLGGAAR